MKRLSALVMVFAILFLFFFIVLVFFRVPFGLYALMSVQDAVDLLTPLLLLPLYFLLFRAALKGSPGGNSMVVFALFAALWAAGQGMHLSANSPTPRNLPLPFTLRQLPATNSCPGFRGDATLPVLAFAPGHGRRGGGNPPMISVSHLTKQFRRLRGRGRRVVRGRAAARSSASSGPTAPARRRRCASSPATCRRRRGDGDGGGLRRRCTTRWRSAGGSATCRRTCPLYPEMRVDEYLRLPGRAEGRAGRQRAQAGRARSRTCAG